MKVAIAICIIFVVINSVYSEHSSNKDSSLSRETRDASPARKKDSKVTQKEKKKQRKLKKKNEGKSKRNKNSKNVNKGKKRKAKKAQRKKQSKNANKAKKKKKKNSAQKKKRKTKTNKRIGKKRSRQGKRKTKKKDRKGKKKLKDNKKKTSIKSKDPDTSHNKVNQIRKTKQDNSSSEVSGKLKKKLSCDNNTKAVNFFKQNRRFYDKYNLLENKLDKISIFKKYASLLGKLTNDGATCTEPARAGYLLMTGCETSAAAACNNTEFTANYTTAIECFNKTINCSTTKIPDECKRDKLAELVAKTRECTNKKLMGSFSYCMSYIKENVSTDISECLDVGTTTVPTTTPTTTPNPTSSPPIETKTIFTEGDEVVEQKESYNPDTKELTLSVPAHGNNVALTAIIGVDQMVTSYDNYCVLGDPPADHTTEVNENSSSGDEANEVDPDSIDKVYTFNVVEGELTDAERAALPESFQTACKDKPIQKSRQIVVDEATFNKESLDSVDGSRIISRQGECSNQKTSCSKFDKGCYFNWANPDGSTVQIHSLPKTVHCLSCCENQTTSTLCQCSEITSGSEWKSCYKKTNGDCGFRGWQCNSTDSCLEYSEQCDGECYGTLNPCGDKCIVPLQPGASSYEYVCQDQCINNTVTCNGTCPASNPVQCGERCLSNRTANYYYECNGKCQPNYRSCDGECPDGHVDCYGYCYSQSTFDNHFWKCGGKCLRKSQPCDGICPNERTLCGDNMCLCSDDDPNCYWPKSNYYRNCDGTCISNWKPCNGACVSGYNFCNYTYSNSYSSKSYDICEPASYFPKYYQYCGACDQCVSSRGQCPPHESSSCPVEPPGEQPILLTTPIVVTTKGLLVTGGATKEVELYNPVSKTSCALPALPEVRGLHTQDGPLLCGGNANTHLQPIQNCMLFNLENGAWLKSHSLRKVRHYHCSWTPASGNGTYILGGAGWLREFSSELVKPDGRVEESFALKHKTVGACAIQEDDRVIITGGHSARTVSVYNETGWIEDLPALKEGRRSHACTSFFSGGKKLMMISGGINGGDSLDQTDTSEIWTGTEWRFTLGKLPYAAREPRMAFIDNRILYLGGNDTVTTRSDILSFNLETEEWTKEGDMLEDRAWHGVSVVDFNVYKKWCQNTTPTSPAVVVVTPSGRRRRFF